VVPADRKWYRDYVVLKTIVEALKPHREAWLAELKSLGEEKKRELDEYRTSIGK
jgi:hypothetical protein